MGPLRIDDIVTAHAVVRTVTSFVQSAEPEIRQYHLPFYCFDFEQIDPKT